MDEMSKQRPNLKNQYFATLVANLLIVTCAISNGWYSAAYVLLTSDKTPLPTGKITVDEASWVAALIYIGGLIGTFFFGFITKRCGRKWLLVSLATLSIIPWLLVYFATNVYYLYASRALNGFFSGGVYIVVPIFLVEVASDDVRGRIVSSLGVSSTIGILCGFIFGTLGFYVTPTFVIASAILSTILFVFFPETPAFLLQQNKFVEMEKSIQFYQNIDSYSKSVVSNAETEVNRNSFKWSDIKSNPGRKALMIGVFLTSLIGLCGIPAILNYSSAIFEKTDSIISPNNSTLVIGSIQVIGSLTTNFLVDRAGRNRA